MEKIFIVGLISFTLLQCKPRLEDPLSDVSGLPGLEKSALAIDQTLIKAEINRDLLKAFIKATLTFKATEGKPKKRRSARKYLANNHAEKVADFIVILANIVEIDPFIFAGLLAHESWYLPDACYSGGCGMAQLTAMGVLEINNHKDRRVQTVDGVKRSQHSVGAHQYIEEMIEKINQAVGGNVFVQVPLTTERSLTLTQYSSIKRNPMTNLIYGALLLKIYLTDEKRQNPALTGNALYKAALMRYNGHSTNKFCYPFEVTQQTRKLAAFHGLDFNIEPYKSDQNCDTAKFPEVYYGKEGTTDEVPVVSAPPADSSPNQDTECWMIQMNAFINIPLAEAERERLIDKPVLSNTDVFIGEIKSSDKDNIPYKVLIGPFWNRKSVDTALSKVKGIKIDGEEKYNDAWRINVRERYPELEADICGD